MSDLVLGIDIGGTNTKYSLVRQDGTIVETQIMPTNAEQSFDIFLKNLNEQIQPYLSRHLVELKNLRVGIGLPNYSSKSNLLVSPPNLSWGTLDVLKGFKETFPLSSVVLENDANVAALGEQKWGAGVGVPDFIVVTVGTGIGTGIISNNLLVTGSTGMAGEGGHIAIQGSGRLCGCGGVDHFESYCSVPSMKKTYTEKFNENKRYRDIVAEFHDGSDSSHEIFVYTSKYFAFALAQLAVCFSPNKFILAGGGMFAGEKFLDMIVAEFVKSVYKPLQGTIDIEISSISTTKGAILGAAALAFSMKK